MKQKESHWIRWQRGQALMEYWPTIPASIIIMLMASGIVTWFNKAILQTVDYLNPTDLRCEQKADEEEGPEVAYLDCHTIKLVGNFYDEEADQTTVAYQVTNGCDPDISHWVLGFPPGLVDKIIASSESYEWVEDPVTGVAGLKFDTGYDSKPPKKAQRLDGLLLTSRSPSASATDSRIVLLTLGGYYDWSIAEVSIKAGTETYHSTITAPVALRQGTDEECQAE